MMNNFTFHIRTKLYFDNTTRDVQLKDIFEDFGYKKVFLVYGGKSLKNNGYYQKIVDNLHQNNICFDEFSNVLFNPAVENIIPCVEKVRAFKPDCLIAIGGGSVIDFTKLVAHSYYYDGDPMDIVKEVVKPINSLPFGTILTLIASGSEMSNSCVISDRKHNFKKGFRSELNYPTFSYLNPYLTETVPSYQISCGIADMFCHTLERYLTDSDELEISDDLALGLLKDIVEVSYRVVDKPFEVNSRSKMMICGTLAHCGVTSFAKNYKMPIHGVEHILSGKYPSIVHGDGINFFMPYYLELNRKELKDKIVKLGEIVFKLKRPSVKKVLETFRSWTYSLNLHKDFSEYGVEKGYIDSLINRLKNKNN